MAYGPEGMCFTGRHTTDREEAVWRKDADYDSDEEPDPEGDHKLESCEDKGCHRSKANK